MDLVFRSASNRWFCRDIADMERTWPDVSGSQRKADISVGNHAEKPSLRIHHGQDAAAVTAQTFGSGRQTRFRAA